MSRSADMNDQVDHLLVVDDSPEDGEFPIDIFFHAGYQVHQADSGHSALDAIAQVKPDLILLKTKLPDLDGFQVCRRLKSDPQSQPIPVIFFSTKDNTLNKMKVYEAGGADHLTPPFEAAELLAKVEVHLTPRRLEARMEALKKQHTDEWEKAHLDFEKQIAEYRRTEEQLHQTNQIQSLILNNNLMGIGLVRNRIFEWVNPRLPEMLGLPLDQVQGAPTRIIYQSDREYEEMERRAGQALSRGEWFEFEIAMSRPDGTTIMGRVIGKALNPSLPQEGSIWIFEDITKRNQAEEAFRESEQVLSDIIEFLPDATFVIDLNGKVIAWNRAIEDMTGVPKEDILGKGNYAYAVPFYGQARPILIDLVFVPDEEITEKYDFVEKRGNQLWAEAFSQGLFHGKGAFLSGIAAPLFDSHGKVIGAIESIRNITERHQAQEALKESEERHRQIFENAGTAIIFIEEDSLITLANKEFEELSGYSKFELEGKKKWAEFIATPADAEKMEKYHRLRRTDPQAAPKNYEFQFMNRNGEIKDIAVTVTVIPGTKQRLAGLLDITERKKTERKLEESEERYRAFFQLSRDAILTLEPPSWKFTAANPSAIEMFGARDEADFISRTAWDYSPPTQPDGRPSEDKAREMIQQAMETGGHFFEWTHQRVSGEPFPATVLLTRTEVGGQVFLQGTIRDVTEQKLAEEERVRLMTQLAQAQKMDAIGNLAGGVAHDFNNLLLVILNCTDFVLECLPPGDPLRIDLVEVKKASERASTLTRQLLAFGHRQVLQPTLLNLNLIVRGVEKMLRRIIREDIDLSVVLAPDLGATLADPGQIEQVIMNLAVNARDAMPEGGTLTIATANADLDEGYAAKHLPTRPGPYVRLAVTDTGCGMDETARARCFEPFFTTKEIGKGTGLGLATVYGIVKQSEGFIWVHSAPGRGSTFEVFLPRSFDATVPDTLFEPEAAATRGTATILVVEDEGVTRNLVRRILEKAGFSVLTAADGAEALWVCEQRPGAIDLVLTDIVMPKMGGKALVDRLASIRPEIKTLFMSGYADKAVIDHGFDAGSAFIPKPFTSEALVRKVREVLETKPGR